MFMTGLLQLSLLHSRSPRQHYLCLITQPGVTPVTRQESGRSRAKLPHMNATRFDDARIYDPSKPGSPEAR